MSLITTALSVFNAGVNFSKATQPEPAPAPEQQNEPGNGDQIPEINVKDMLRDAG
ncbi:MAG: hypothetical protein V4754_18970 [Pseudomonadota bacterium]